MTKEERKDFYKKVNALAVHTCLQELFAVFANMLNSIMLSFVGSTYLSAATLAGQYVNIYTFSSLGLTLAVLMLSTQYYGKNDTVSIKKILHISLLFSIILSLLFFLIAFFAPQIVMKIITNDSELILAGSEYLKYFSFVFLFNAFSKTYIAILKAVNKQQISTIASIIANIGNFLISLVLIFGFITGKPLGVVGAALSSSIAALIETLFLFIYGITLGPIKFSLIEFFHIDFFFAKEIFRYSLPTIMTKFLWSTADTLKTSIIGHMSRDIIDAYSFMRMLGNIPNAFLCGFGIAFGIILGHELGKGNTKLAKTYGDEGIKYTRIVAFAMAILMMVLGLIGLKISHIDGKNFNTYLFIAILFTYQYFVGSYINFFNNGPFTAGGEVEFLALVDIINMWVVIVPVGMILFYILKLPEIIVLIFLFSNELTKFAPIYSHYKKYVWARDLTKNDWFLPIAGSFIDKYKRNFKLRVNISITEFFTKRFENTTDFIFSISRKNLEKMLEDLQNYLININLDKTTAYKTVLAIEEIYTSRDGDFNCDVGVKLKDNKIRFIYYDNGPTLKEILSDKSKTNIQILTSIADKLECSKALNLNKILIRIDRKNEA